VSSPPQIFPYNPPACITLARLIRPRTGQWFGAKDANSALALSLLRRASFIRQGSEAEDGKTNHPAAARQQAKNKAARPARRANAILATSFRNVFVN
jgi:hypothetical protein